MMSAAADARADSLQSRHYSPRHYSLILFDLDEVLVDYDHRARLELLAARSGSTCEQVHAALIDSGLEHESDLGDWLPESYAHELSRRLAAPVSLKDCVDARAASMRVRPAMLDLAQRAAQRARVAILTNNGLYLRDALPVTCPELFPLFTGAVRYGAEFHRLKPDPEVYLRCVASLDAKPDQVLFIDDRAQNVTGAIEAGLDAVRFISPGILKEVFVQRGVIDR